MSKEWIEACQAGLSPRLRGNPPAQLLGNAGEGSIPAPAGEPCRKEWSERSLPGRSIPAPAGEPSPAQLALAMLGILGLSPRLRGNPSLEWT